ncbi:hypothetical protein CL614_08105 [archaeon]|nr:hypothetical protein [archaeon]
MPTNCEETTDWYGPYWEDLVDSYECPPAPPMAIVTDTINLYPNWNLISFDVSMQNAAPEDVFADLIADNNLVYVTGYDEGSSYYDPANDIWWSTLTQIRDGFGYWVKTAPGVSDTVSGTGTPLTLMNQTFDFKPGWNQIAYWPSVSMTPEVAFQELINQDLVIWVTGFTWPAGAHFFEPGGILNTLGILENGYGYWVKMTDSFDGFQYPVSGRSSSHRKEMIQLTINSDIKITNTYMFINGTVSCMGFECKNGTKVDVLTDTGLLVGELLITKNGLLQTGAIYGDDPITENIDGAQMGQSLKFVYNDITAQSKEILFNGNMEVKKIKLQFDSNQQSQVKLIS